MFHAALELVDRAVRALLALLLAVMVASVTWQIVSRYLLVSPSSWTEELARFMLIWIGLVGGAYAYRRGMHLGLELLAERLPVRTRPLHAALVHVAVGVFAAIALVGGGGNLVALTYSLSQYSPGLELPMAVVYLALPLAGVLILIYAIAGVADSFRGNAGAAADGDGRFRANVPPVDT
jgi:TRAP-type C4-dicarboxylate transport system permease small subunit